MDNNTSARRVAQHTYRPAELATRRRDEARHCRNSALAAARAAGDPDARGRLVEENMALVHYTVRRMHVDRAHYDDAVSVGMLGLVHAVRRWDPLLGASLGTYASPWIEQYVKRYLRAEHTAIGLLSPVDDFATGDDGDAYWNNESQADSGQQVVELHARARTFRAAVRTLDQDMQDVMRHFVAHLGDEGGAARAAGLALGAWRRRCDRAWSMLRHPAGPCLGDEHEQLSERYHRWRILPVTGTFARRAACAGLGVARFFPTPGTTTEDATRICSTCPVQQACGAHAIAVSGIVGVWGGLSDHERQQRRRAAGQQQA